MEEGSPHTGRPREAGTSCSSPGRPAGRSGTAARAGSGPLLAAERPESLIGASESDRAVGCATPARWPAGDARPSRLRVDSEGRPHAAASECGVWPTRRSLGARDSDKWRRHAARGRLGDDSDCNSDIIQAAKDRAGDRIPGRAGRMYVIVRARARIRPRARTRRSGEDVRVQR